MSREEGGDGEVAVGWMDGWMDGFKVVVLIMSIYKIY